MQTPEVYETNTQVALSNAISLTVGSSDVIASGSKRAVAGAAAQVALSLAAAGVNALLAVAAACNRR